MGRLKNEYNDENCEEGLKAYIEEKQQEIIFKWQNEKRGKKIKAKEERKNEKM